MMIRALFGKAIIYGYNLRKGVQTAPRGVHFQAGVQIEIVENTSNGVSSFDSAHAVIIMSITFKKAPVSTLYNY